MRGLVAALLALAFVGCATNRAALQPVGQPVDASSVATTPGSPRPCPPPATGPLPAQTLAQRLGLSYRDSDSHVLLADEVTRVRIWKDSYELSVDGRTVRLGDRTKRQGRSLIVPKAMVNYVETQVGAQRSRFARPARRRPRTVTPALVLPTLPEPKPPSDVYRKAPPAEPQVAVEVPSDPAWEPCGCARSWRWIVIHHSDDRRGNLAKYDRIHREANGWDECGYHFVIGNGTGSGDGEIEIGSRWIKQKHGAHTKTPDNLFNELGVGICLVGDFESCGPPTPAQMDALVGLCRWLITRFDVELPDVKGHGECKATACPGRHFPWAELRQRLRTPCASTTAP